MNTRLVAPRLALALCLTAGCAGRHKEITAMPKQNDLVAIWLASVDRVTRDDWTALEDWGMLDSAVRGNSSMWLERFLSPAADPQNCSG
ncbi:MAG: hypothetical protein D6744_01475, partial [Planctomycetota bacterium]